MFQYLRGTALIAAIILSCGASAGPPNQFLCIVEHSAGLHYDKQSKVWTPAAFATGAKYIVRRVNSNDVAEQEKKKWGLWLQQILQNHPKADWFFSQFGEKDAPPIAVCDDDAGHTSIFICTTVIGAASVEFVSSALRFEIVRNGGYVVQGGLKQFADTPPEIVDNPNDLSFEVGKCSPF
jgi:hypothetical protein